ETESKDGKSDEIRKFVIEHEFRRRIAKKVRMHLEEFLKDKKARGPLARYLKTYSVFILDHTSEEDRFLADVKEKRSLSSMEERKLKREFERMKQDCVRKSGNLLELLKQLENTEWAG